MTIRADRDPRYYFKFLLIGLAAVGFALWSLYDGAIKYPAQRERGLVYDEFEESGKLDHWDEEAASRGWPTEIPERPTRSEADIVMQYAMVLIAGLIGFAALFGVWRSRGRWIESSGSGITSSWGQSLDYDQVISLDKRQWRGKGIAKVKYQDGNRRRTFVIDDFKFHREPTDSILREMEANIGYDKIVNGPPEPPVEEFDEAAAQS